MALKDKAKIIEAIQQTDNERILFAIKRWLQIEKEDIPEWHLGNYRTKMEGHERRQSRVSKLG